MPETSRREAAEQFETPPFSESKAGIPEEKSAEVIPINPEVARSREEERLMKEYREISTRIRTLQRELFQMKEGIDVEVSERLVEKKRSWLSRAADVFRGKDEKPFRTTPEQQKDLADAVRQVSREILALDAERRSVAERLPEEKESQLREETMQLDAMERELRNNLE